MNLYNSREREAHSGELVQLYGAICWLCNDFATVKASSRAEAQKTLRGAGWHTTQGHWYCSACYVREQGYREYERRYKQRHQEEEGGD